MGLLVRKARAAAKALSPSSFESEGGKKEKGKKKKKTDKIGRRI